MKNNYRCAGIRHKHKRVSPLTDIKIDFNYHSWCYANLYRNKKKKNGNSLQNTVIKRTRLFKMKHDSLEYLFKTITFKKHTGTRSQ